MKPGTFRAPAPPPVLRTVFVTDPKPPSSAKRSRSIGRRPPVEARRPIAGCLIVGCPIVGCPIAGCPITGCPITGCEMARRPPRRPPHLGVFEAAAIRR
jgi:hypothetical protein